MLLLLRRNQKSALLSSSIIFTLDARTELTHEEHAAITKYKLGKTILFKNYDMGDRGSGLLGAASRWYIKNVNVHIEVDDLVNGKHVECKDIAEMKWMEEQLITACQNLKAILETAVHFGGEEVVPI